MPRALPIEALLPRPSRAHASPWPAIPALALALAGCAPSARPAPLVPAADDPRQRPFLAPLELVGDRADDAIVRVAGPVGCSGSLIADDLVLTAHHCVVRASRRGFEPVEPGSLRVELGGDDLPWGEVGVRYVVAPPCGHVRGAGDVALLVLERPLRGMPLVQLRLHEPPTIGATVAPRGFGRCAAARTAIRRHHRSGGAIERVGPGVFEARASVCPGDSGGPVFDVDAQQVVGVVSAAVMDPSPATRDEAQFARIDRFAELFSRARAIADGAHPAELPPIEACEGLAQRTPRLVASPP